jgi:hypothetical protein
MYFVCYLLVSSGCRNVGESVQRRKRGLLVTHEHGGCCLLQEPEAPGAALVGAVREKHKGQDATGRNKTGNTRGSLAF